MNSTVLCIADLSISSGFVVRQACRIAQQFHHHLIILYCYRLKVTSSNLAPNIKRLQEKEAGELFAKIESEFIREFNIPYEFRAEVGFLIDRVAEHVRQGQISFVILDKKMKREDSEIFDELLERTSVPITLITGSYPDVDQSVTDKAISELTYQ